MTIIITGASRGVGKYLFDFYTNRGEVVYGTYNSTPPLDVDLDFFYKVDVSNYANVKRWITEISHRLENIVLVNCAGISYNSFAHKCDINRWNEVIDVNLKGTFNVIRCLLPIMRDQSFGRIINMSSVVAQLPTPGISAYAASKAALYGLSKSICVENARKCITINSISMGYMDIGMGVNDVPAEYRSIITKQIPSNKFGDAEEIINTIDYIITTPYLTGSNIDINGGLL